MRKYRVKWVESHQQDVYAKNEEDAYQIADVNMQAETYKGCSLQDLEILEEVEHEDDMDRAHYHAENP